MVKKRTKRYDDGGTVVVGNKPQGDWGGGGTGFTNMGGYTMPSGGGMALGRGSAGSGGGNTSQRLTPISPPGSPVSTGPQFTPAVVSQPQSSLGQLAGAVAPRGYGVSGRFSFAKGGKVKAKTKKMAKGGSTASKRADGCATKGKTKGRFV